MSNGLGRYSNAPRSVARTAVSSVFCALITMTGRSGRSERMRGSRSRVFSSGRPTSVMTTSPSPAAIHFHKAAAMLVACTS
jgi:hypothetical protein